MLRKNLVMIMTMRMRLTTSLMELGEQNRKKQLQERLMMNFMRLWLKLKVMLRKILMMIIHIRMTLTKCLKNLGDKNRNKDN